MSDARVMRGRQDDAAAAVRRLVTAGHHGSEAVLAQTKAVGTYPTNASAFYACTPLKVEGAETEGAAATFSADASRTVMSFNLGTKVPPLGTKLIVHSCDGRWTFRYDG